MSSATASQPISIVTHNLDSSASRYSPQSMACSSVTSVDWSASSSSALSQPSFPPELIPRRTVSQPGGRALAAGMAGLGLEEDECESSLGSPSGRARARLSSASTAPTSLGSDKPEDEERGADALQGGKVLVASAPALSFQRKQTNGRNSPRPRAHTDVSGKGRGGLEALVGILPGETAAELACWINACPSPFEPSAALTATALDAIEVRGSALTPELHLPLGRSRADEPSTPQPKKISIGFIPGPGVTSTQEVQTTPQASS